MGVSIGRAVAVGLVLGSMAVAGAGVASAQSAGEAIKQRQALMKANGKAFGVFVGFVKKGKGSAADVEKQARGIAARLADLPDLFPKGSSLADGAGKTRAKPEIWQQWAAFEADAAKTSKLAWDLSLAAVSGDKQAIGAAFDKLGKDGCTGCHRAFRGPKQ